MTTVVPGQLGGGAEFLGIEAEVAEDPYVTNMQVADMNMLNAALAVGRWKRLSGFYADAGREQRSIYAVDGNSLMNVDADAAQANLAVDVASAT